MIQYLADNTFRLRSFVRRDSRMTAAQVHAYETYWPTMGLSLHDGMVDVDAVFGRHAPCYLEIGFGSGHSLLQVAKAMPDANFIGIETHKPGIGALLLAMQQENVRNIRIYHADAVDVLNTCIPEGGLQGAHLFFPDPWPKRKHHLRRLVQLSLVELLFAKIKSAGTLHLATDWEEYAQHMSCVMQQSSFRNLFSSEFSPIRSAFRPVVTKFEQRALSAGRGVWELQFAR